jgi:hypothetical protein
MWKMIQLKARLKRLAKARQDRDEYSRQMGPGTTPWQFATLEGKLESAMDEIDRHWAWFEANGSRWVYRANHCEAEGWGFKSRHERARGVKLALTTGDHPDPHQQ